MAIKRIWVEALGKEIEVEIPDDPFVPYVTTPVNTQQPPPPPPANPYPPVWQAEDNEESQTNTENDTNYNRRDVNAEAMSGAWKAYLIDQAKQREAEWGWNPYDESDLMGVIRNMTNARNTQSDTYYLGEVLKNWEARNASQQGGSTGRSGGSSGGGGGGRGSLAPPSTAAGWMPTYVAPVWADRPAPFVGPTLAEAQAEPGYQFALQEGQRAMENTAGSKGLLRTGGTLRSLLGYGQRMGETNYNNVFDRKKNVYELNYENSEDAYEFLLRNSEFAFAPRQREAELNFQALMDQWKTTVGVAQDIFHEGSD